MIRLFYIGALFFGITQSNPHPLSPFPPALTILQRMHVFARMQGFACQLHKNAMHVSEILVVHLRANCSRPERLACLPRPSHLRREHAPGAPVQKCSRGAYRCVRFDPNAMDSTSFRRRESKRLGQSGQTATITALCPGDIV